MHARAQPLAVLMSAPSHPPKPIKTDLVFRVVHAMWRRLERSTATAMAVGGTTRPGSVAGASQERFWQAVARKPAALAFFAKYYRQQVRDAMIKKLLSCARHPCLPCSTLSLLSVTRVSTV